MYTLNTRAENPPFTQLPQLIRYLNDFSCQFPFLDRPWKSCYLHRCPPHLPYRSPEPFIPRFAPFSHNTLSPRPRRSPEKMGRSIIIPSTIQIYCIYVSIHHMYLCTIPFDQIYSIHNRTNLSINPEPCICPLPLFPLLPLIRLLPSSFCSYHQKSSHRNPINTTSNTTPGTLTERDTYIHKYIHKTSHFSPLLSSPPLPSSHLDQKKKKENNQTSTISTSAKKKQEKGILHP